MSELFAAFRQHLVWSLMLWVLIFTAFTALFANGRLIAFAVGLGRVLGSIVVTPFLFIRRAVAAVMGHSVDAEARYRASDQYLLNKGMLLLQAMVIVIAVGVLSAAVVVTWNAFVPPSEVRREAREYATQVEAQRRRSADAAATMAKLDADWAQIETAVVAAYRGKRQSQITSTSKDMTAIERSVQGYAATTLQSVKETIASRSRDSVDDIQTTKRRIDWTVNNNWYWLGDWRPTLERWNELWLAKTVAEVELETLSVENLRIAEQTPYVEAKAARDIAAETLAAMEPVLAQHQEAASLKWKAAFFRALGSFVTFLLFVWFAGALIEGGWMAIRIADDVRRIRQRTREEEAAAAPSAAEVWIPIREGVPGRAAEA
jgi:Tfp pilus assembly protein PilE